MKRLLCRFRGHAEARFVMLPEFFGLYRYSRIECRRCGALIEDGYHPTDEENAAYEVWAVSPDERASVA
jgi:hypothetical protein